KPVAALFGLGEYSGVFGRLSKLCHHRGVDLQIVIGTKPAVDRGFQQPGSEIISQASVEHGGLAVFGFRIAVCEEVLLSLCESLLRSWRLGCQVASFHGAGMEERAVRKVAQPIKSLALLSLVQQQEDFHVVRPLRSRIQLQKVSRPIVLSSRIENAGT